MSLGNSAQMQKTFKLPLLPGNSTGDDLLRRNFRRAQFGNGEKMLAAKDVPVDFDSTLVSQSVKSPTNMNMTGGSAAGTSLDRKVLRFYGYYREPVHESAVESERIRKVVMCYFLEDDTMSVTEPKQDNSGISTQGTLVKRHQIPKADGPGTVTFDNIGVAADITFYGRSYRIVSCDEFTRSFLTEMGMQVAEPEDYPSDQYTSVRNRPKEKPGESMATNINASGMKVKLSAQEIRATKQFLKDDRKVLRFKAVWDDTNSLYGENRIFTMFYFVADDTIEVTEVSENNSGRDPFPSFVRRQKCVKPRTDKFENQSASLTFAHKNPTEASFYTVDDLRIGSIVHLFGRKLLIFDCDKFTQDYLRAKFGITDFTPIHVKQPQKLVVKREPPPHNGFGNEEDSLGSWKSLVLKPPRRNMAKYMANVNNQVKFSLKLDNAEPTDAVRRFVLTYFIADDTISIFEPVQRNSGIVGGKFLQRGKVKKPDGTYYKPADFFVGGRIQIHGFNFIVQASDERSLVFMEQHSDEFDKSNVNVIVSKLQAMFKSNQTGLAQAFQESDENANGALDLEELTYLFHRLDLPITDQETLTVMRHFDADGDGSLTYMELADKILPADSAVMASDPRSWEEIHEEDVAMTGAVVNSKHALDAHNQKVVATTAAYAARRFNELYNNRRTLFQTTFKFATDYSPDGKIGEKEFRECCGKLQVDLSQPQLDALCQKLFPIGVRRVETTELLKLFNGTSNFSSNITQIQSRRS